MLLVCNVRLFGEGLAYSLGQRAGARIRVVGTAADADEALRRVRELEPALVLIDIGVPDAAGIVQAMLAHSPELRVLVLGIDESDKEVLAAAEAGACGYVARHGSIADLIVAVERAAQGEVLCPPRIVGSLFRRVASLASDRDQPNGLGGLTAREREVVDLIGEGLSNKEIARRLGIRVATVKNHVHNSLEKLGVRRRYAVAALLNAADRGYRRLRRRESSAGVNSGTSI